MCLPAEEAVRVDGDDVGGMAGPNKGLIVHYNHAGGGIADEIQVLASEGANAGIVPRDDIADVEEPAERIQQAHNGMGVVATPHGAYVQLEHGASLVQEFVHEWAQLDDEV
ncbi:hypothetical protein GOP47_0028947 [Adiantum capillus-veneris]|nr:hypothetical protein GOP47_0028947 [Adiantum capillus-veneris]